MKSKENAKSSGSIVCPVRFDTLMVAVVVNLLLLRFLTSISQILLRVMNLFKYHL